MIVKPLNKRLLLEQIQLEEKENSLGFFLPDDKKTQALGDFYRVLDIAPDCGMMLEKGDLISAEITTPIGKVEGKLYFVCHENSVIAYIKE